MCYFGCMNRQHHYSTRTRWTGNHGSGTLDYRAYSRDHVISSNGKETEIPGSSDSAFRGDRSRYNPEEFFLSSISACHMLWYLHLAAVNDIVVLEYEDHAEGTMEEDATGAGSFSSVTLNPNVVIAGPQVQRARELHNEAGQKCFIANSIKVPITYAGSVNSVVSSSRL